MDRFEQPTFCVICSIVIIVPFGLLTAMTSLPEVHESLDSSQLSSCDTNMLPNGVNWCQRQIVTKGVTSCLLRRMAAALKRKQVRMYLSDEDERRLKELAEAIPVLSEAMIASTILSAGLAACSSMGNRLPLPLKFQIIESIPEEQKPLTKVRRP
jgi:hypothetical protein